MHSKGRLHFSIFGPSLTPLSAALAIMLTLLFLLLLLVIMNLTAQPAQGQMFKVIYNFTGGADGGLGESLTADRLGNLYGTTWKAGGTGNGTVFKFSSGSLTTLYSFTDGGYGDFPFPAHQIMVGPDGSLYGTAKYGALGWGSVFNLRPPATACRTASCPWIEAVLYRFTGGNDGANPSGAPVLDGSGNVYGTTIFGGSGGECNPGPACGVLFKLMPFGGAWTETVLHNFTLDGQDGIYPLDGVFFDSAGALNGTTVFGGDSGGGNVFRLKPSGSGWEYSVIYDFGSNYNYGGGPFGNLTFDGSGSSYGSTGGWGAGGGGTIFELSPSGQGWTFGLLYSFLGNNPNEDFVNLTIDSAGSIYGTAFYPGAYGKGSVFKLAPGIGGWTYTSLHDFTGGSDGAYPGSLVLDAAGNLYGTTLSGGASGWGVIWEITP